LTAPSEYVLNPIIARDLARKKVALFLGAGAAVCKRFPPENRLPTGESLKRILLRYYYNVDLRDSSKDKENIRRFCRSEGIRRVENLRPEVVWAKILEERGEDLTSHIHILKEIFDHNKFVPPNYKIALRLLMSDLFTTIITTNFDEKIDEALAKVQQESNGKKREIVLIASTDKDFAYFKYGLKGTKVIYKLHGTLSKPYTIRSSKEDINKLSSEKSEIIKRVWEDNDWIFFVGYGGKDEDVMDVLTHICTATGYKDKIPKNGKIFWISLEKPKDQRICKILKNNKSLNNIELVDAGIFFIKLQDIFLPGITQIGGRPYRREVSDFLQAYGVKTISSLQQNKTFEDPILGVIRFPDKFGADIVSLINTAEIQRLRDIKQLSFAHLRYPNATHSRFMHSLGVAGLVSHALEKLRSKNDLDISDDEFRMTVISALLHDVGHGPFGHVIETFDMRISGTRNFAHETMIRPFLRSGELGERLDDLIISRSEIELRSQGESRCDDKLFLSQLIAKYGLDLDRIEFLMRDSLFCGIDIRSLFGSRSRKDIIETVLSSIDVFEAKEADLDDYRPDTRLICFNWEIKPVILNLLNLYVDMYKKVYHCITNLKAQAMMAKALHIAYLAGDLNPYELYSFTDSELFTLLENIEDPIVRKLTWAVKYRRLFEVVTEFDPVKVLSTVSINELENRIAEICSLKEEDFRSLICINVAPNKAVTLGRIFLKRNNKVEELDTSEFQKELAKNYKGYIFAPPKGLCFEEDNKRKIEQLLKKLETG